MSTQRETIEYILEVLRDPKRFSARPMFGEYALYADGKVVALVCDNQLFVKVVPASGELEAFCEKGPPYPGAKPYYIVEEEQLTQIEHLALLLLEVAESLPVPKKKVKRSQ